MTPPAKSWDTKMLDTDMSQVQHVLDAIGVEDTDSAAWALEGAFDWDATGELVYWSQCHDALLAGTVPEGLVDKLRAMLGDQS